LVNQARLRYENLPSGGPTTVEPWELTVEGVFGPGPPAKDGEGEQNRTAQELPLLAFLRTDLVIDMPRNIWVQGAGTAIEAGGRLKVAKDLNRPFIVAGDIRTVRGFATLVGRRFTVETGEIVFTGAPEIDPVLNVVALHRVSSYNVFVEVTGLSSKPDLAFRSEPELSESDVMSLLVFGRTGDKLSSSEQGSLTGALAGGVASSLLESTVGKTFGVDTINVDLSDPDGATFGVGRYLTNDVFLSYDRTFRDPKKGNAGGSTVGIEYSFGPRFSIRATGSDFGETAVDLLWGFDY
jgi:autotransporter translocation and assembly factor TamB